MKRLILIIFAFLLIAGVAILTDTGSAFAQDDNGTTTNGDNGEPEFDPKDNWCNNPDIWGDGRCGDGTTDESQYMWRQGWINAHAGDYIDNWCNNPAHWGDGRCNVEGDVWLTNWFYICGYYMARIESGEYPKGIEGQLVAEGCLVELPPPEPLSPASTPDEVEFCTATTPYLSIGTHTYEVPPGGFLQGPIYIALVSGVTLQHNTNWVNNWLMTTLSGGAGVDSTTCDLPGFGP